MAISPATKSLKDVYPVPVTVVAVEDEDEGAVHPALYFLESKAVVFGVPTRSPAANVKITL